MAAHRLQQSRNADCQISSMGNVYLRLLNSSDLSFHPADFSVVRRRNTQPRHCCSPRLVGESFHHGFRYVSTQLSRRGRGYRRHGWLRRSSIILSDHRLDSADLPQLQPTLLGSRMFLSHRTFISAAHGSRAEKSGSPSGKRETTRHMISRRRVASELNSITPFRMLDAREIRHLRWFAA
jgi:hypothetical protein